MSIRFFQDVMVARPCRCVFGHFCWVRGRYIQYLGSCRRYMMVFLHRIEFCAGDTPHTIWSINSSKPRWQRRGREISYCKRGSLSRISRAVSFRRRCGCCSFVAVGCFPFFHGRHVVCLAAESGICPVYQTLALSSIGEYRMWMFGSKGMATTEAAGTTGRVEAKNA